MPRSSKEEQEFERFRRERQRGRTQRGSVQGGAFLGGFGSDQGDPPFRDFARPDCPKEREQRISNDVQDFFAEATKHAKTIVERVAREANAAAKTGVEREVELFLLDALERMNDFVIDRIALEGEGADEHDVSPTMMNLVGDALDEFRESGTASTEDKHLGKNPFLINVQEVQRAFRERILSLRAAEEAPPAAIDDVSMIDVVDDDGVADEFVEGEELEPPPVPTRAKAGPLPAPEAVTAVARPVDDSPSSASAESGRLADAPAEVAEAAEPALSAAAPASPTEPDPQPAIVVPTEPAPAVSPPSMAAVDVPTSVASAPVASQPAAAAAVDVAALERLRQALKMMVANGTMSRDEAVAVWRKRVSGG